MSGQRFSHVLLTPFAYISVKELPLFAIKGALPPLSRSNSNLLMTLSKPDQSETMEGGNSFL